MSQSNYRTIISTNGIHLNNNKSTGNKSCENLPIARVFHFREILFRKRKFVRVENALSNDLRLFRDGGKLPEFDEAFFSGKPRGSSQGVV